MNTIIAYCLSMLMFFSQQSYIIIGDSWSTFKDYTIPQSNASWYPSTYSDCEGYGTGNDVILVQHTWWSLLQTNLHLKLLGNYSYSGSPICYDGYGPTNTDAKQYSFITRIKSIDPRANLLFIQGGINDSAAGAEIGEYKYDNWTEEDFSTFRPALAYVLDYCKTYTNAKVVFLKSDIIRDDISESIDTICEYYKVPVLTLANIELTAWHPNYRGMRQIYDQIRDFLLEEYSNEY